MFGRKKKQATETARGGELPIGLGQAIEEVVKRHKRRDALHFEGKTVSYQELDENANRVATGLQSLGIQKGDRVAMMLPNIPDFAYSFLGIQKLGAVAVPFNTMYKGREISFILKDSGAKAIICLSNFANLINELRDECPDLAHVIVTGQRTLVFLDPEATVNVQLVFEKTRFSDPEDAMKAVGNVFVETYKKLGIAEAWYKHQGAVRVGGRKIATILLSEIENLYIGNIVTFLKDMDSEPLFKVLYVPPEIKDKALEPLTSIATESGKDVTMEQFRDALSSTLAEQLQITIEAGELTRDEMIAYEKNTALANRI